MHFPKTRIFILSLRFPTSPARLSPIPKVTSHTARTLGFVTTLAS